MTMAESSTGRVQGANRIFIEAHRRSYVSQHGVIAVLESVKKHGLPKHLSRQTLKRSRQDEIDCNSPMGEFQRISSHQPISTFVVYAFNMQWFQTIFLGGDGRAHVAS